MKKETLRYQRLAGIITESQYNSKLEENVASNLELMNEDYKVGDDKTPIKIGDMVSVVDNYWTYVYPKNLSIYSLSIYSQHKRMYKELGFKDLENDTKFDNGTKATVFGITKNGFDTFYGIRTEDGSESLIDARGVEKVYDDEYALNESTKWVHEFLKPHDIITLKKGTLLSVNTSSKGYVTIEIPEETEAVYFGVNNHHEAEVAITNDIGSKIGTVDFGDIKELSDIKLRWDEDENDWKVVTPEFLNRFNSDSTRMEENSDVLDEIGIGTILGGVAIAALVKKAYDKYKNYAERKGLEETGEEKRGKNGVVSKEYTTKDGGTYWGITYEDKTRDEGYTNPRIFLFTPDRIDKVLNADLNFATSDEDMMSDNYEKKFGQFTADKIVKL
jgi:hypothetical protein